MTWQDCFIQGIAPELSDKCLIALHSGLVNEDPALTHESTTVAPLNGPPQMACALGYAIWKGEGHTLGEQVEERVETIAVMVGYRFGDPAAIRSFFKWWDIAPEDIGSRRDRLAGLVKQILYERGHTDLR